ncbi:hypothetical protein K458DRAFT_14772 [Lentithecium fluviatile CBS 122367]|uniref:Uncharacterized protein n=1 Tax=Lentithecium fluviatile CBS 122367 TaxID=1168545 RepID=A0A6G1J5Y7_9PLEO|nr:hypothetical protein K458DRAFT_14772 [Lentithecium fluviatile CBS 122367]
MCSRTTVILSSQQLVSKIALLSFPVPEIFGMMIIPSPSPATAEERETSRPQTTLPRNATFPLHTAHSNRLATTNTLILSRRSKDNSVLDRSQDSRHTRGVAQLDVIRLRPKQTLCPRRTRERRIVGTSELILKIAIRVKEFQEELRERGARYIS